MSKELPTTSPRLRTLAPVILTTFLAVLCCFPGGGTVQAAGGGAANAISGPPVFSPFWGARKPRVCSAVTTPPNAEQIPALIQCYMEKETREFETLMQNIKIQVDGTRAVVLSDTADNVDSYAKIVMFHGTNDYYSCAPINEAVMHNTGKNCSYTRSANVTGTCWKVHAGNYQCEMHFLVGPVGRANTYPGQPGPAGY